MEAQNAIRFDKKSEEVVDKKGLVLNSEDKLNLGHIKFAQGIGASLRYANELRAVQQTGRLPFLKSSKLHEDVLRGELGPGTGFKNMFGDQEETGPSRLAFL